MKQIIILMGIILSLVLSPILASAQETNPNPEEQYYTGPIAPDNPIYPIKIGFENLDEFLTFNESRKLEKKLEHAELRIKEANTMLLKNKPLEASTTLARYNAKINEVNKTLTGTGLASQMVIKHQVILYNLITTYPNNTGIQKAYNNSMNLEQKFISKHEIH